MPLGIAATKYQDTAAGPWPTRYWDFGTFFQDDIRLTNKLTINLGLRYSIQSPPDGKIGNFQLDTLKVVNSWGPNAVPYAGIKFDKTNFAPRIGVAWAPFNDKTVVRAGFGIFYGTDGSSFG
jgi:outer membrane receptor protein involved in Fe transport